MSATAENNLWYKGKQQIIHDYHKEIEGVVSALAAKNFINPPGYVPLIAAELEFVAKLKLSDLNFQIAREAIDRELQSSGIDYDNAYKDLLAAWELSKQTLMTKLQQELGQAENTIRLSIDAAQRYAMEIGFRKTDVLEAESNLKRQLEQKQREIMAARQTPNSSEYLLLSAKAMTLSKKLEAIPYIDAILTAEEALVEKITAELIPSKKAFIEEYTQYIEKKEALLPVMQELSAAKVAYAEALQDEIQVLQDIKDYDKQDATARKTLLEHNIDLLTAQIRLELARRTNMLQGFANRNSEIQNGIELDTETTNSIVQISQQQVDAIGTLADHDGELMDAAQSLRIAMANINIDGNETINKADVNSTIDRIDTMSDNQRNAAEERAIIAATATISTELRHLLS